MNERPTPDVDEDDCRLMVGIREHDEAAFQTFYKRYCNLVYSLCLRVTGKSQDAEDATSEIFLELWQKSDRYCPSKGSPYTYLMMLTRCRALDCKRGLTRRTHAVLEWAAVESSGWASGQAAPFDDVSAAELRELVCQAIGKLDGKHRQAIELAFFDGLTHQATANEVEVPLGTIKGRIRRALDQLRQHLLACKRD